LSLASHQLRTPLSGTKWLIETIKRGILGQMTKKQKEYLNQIYQLNERMIRLVGEMLNVLRLDSEMESIKQDKVSILNFCKDLPTSMLAMAKSREIILSTTLEDCKFVTIKTDQSILKSILECFISNAIDYSQNGQEVILAAKERPAAIIFSVKDSGLGIPKNEQNRIFERFYRTSNAKDFKPSGTGLGLNIAKTLAERIGAEISFESKENKGSTFYLRIPKKSSNIIQK
jgi:signal transduction histidine kinase